MDVNPISPGPPISIEAARAAAARRAAARRESGVRPASGDSEARDVVSLSEEARQLASIGDSAASGEAESGERAALVAALKSSVDAGTYSLNAAAVAEALLEHGDG